MTDRIAVVGGGISGLSAALALEPLARARGLELHVFEREPRWGGAIRTFRQDTLVIDGGPDCFLARKPQGVALCRDLGIEGRLMGLRPGTSGAYVLADGKLRRIPLGWTTGIPRGVRPLLGARLLPVGARLRALRDLVPGRPVEGDVSLGAYLRGRLGDGIVDRLVDPILSGVYAGDLDALSLESCAPELAARARSGASLIWGMVRRRPGPPPTGSVFLTVDTGMQGLVEAALDRLGSARLHAATPVTALARTGDGYELTLAGGGRLDVRGVVLALPAPRAARVLASAAPRWAQALERVDCVDLAVVGLAYRDGDVGVPLDGTGFVVPRRERRAITAATWLGAKWPRPSGSLVPVRAFLGRAGDRGLLDLSDEQLVAKARGELEPLMGITAEPMVKVVFRHPQGLPQYTVGHGQRMRALAEATRAWPAFALAGSAWDGVGIPDCIRSGQGAAAIVAADLGLSGGT